MAANAKALRFARRGARLLDRTYGRSWRRIIRRRDLDMSSGSYDGRGDCGCILAQLYGGYSNGIDALGLDFTTDTCYGFDTGREVDDYETLDAAWLKVLREDLS